MPVGFENSALKMSFSLSSLQSGAGQGSPQQARMQAERPYNSLTKKTRETAEREMWRRSWGTQEEKKDEFWAALQPNYNYLMDNNLIESCREADGELPFDEDDATKWSFKDFNAQFSELCSWLDDIREAIYGKEENIRDRNLRLEHVGAMYRNAYKRILFTKQARRLLLDHSELQEEVTWRVNHLNSKWEMLEQFISPSKIDSSQINFCADVEHEADCLKEWIREMEHRLKPLNMQIVNNWNNQELVEKITEHEVLHQDIRAHGKVVAAVLKRAELAEATASVQLAKRLERRWHLLFLRALEWQFHLEHLLKLRKHPPPERSCSESDEEPLSKHPRLSSTDCSDHLTDDGSYFEDDIKDFCVQDRKNSDATAQDNCPQSRKSSYATVIQKKDAAISVGESETQNQKCDATKHTKEISSDKLCDSFLDDTAFSSESLVRTVNTVGFVSKSNERTINLCNYKSCQQSSVQSNHMELCESVPGCVENAFSKVSEGKVVEDSSDEEWTYTSGRRTVISKQKENITLFKSLLYPSKRSVATRLDFGENAAVTSIDDKDNNSSRYASGESDQGWKCMSNEASSFPSSLENTKECIQLLVHQAELLVREDSLSCTADLVPVSESKQARIKQWVKMHSPAGDPHQLPDSCDASGEYTTGDSDEEYCSEYLEDSSGMVLVNKHLDALMDSRTVFETSESFKDSKVILRRDRDGAKDGTKGTANKQGGKRERPWSVSGISQLTVGRKEDDATYLTNFSTSESALHQITNTPVLKNREHTAVSSKSLQDNLSSSTMHDTSCNNSLPRRKGRHRRKHSANNNAKFDSPTDSPNVLSSENALSSPKHQNASRNVLKAPISETQEVDEPQFNSETKVRTVSETTCTSIATEINIISDSSNVPTESNSSKMEDGIVASGNQIPVEPVFPIFRLGPEQGAITPLAPKTCLDPNDLLQAGGDSDVERMGASQNADDQLSSSEPTWDSYQGQSGESLLLPWMRNSGHSSPWEKYLSEPYSEEIADSEEARRLLEFGDDYHNFLDSMSDCASSIEFFQKISPTRKRKSIVAVGDSSVLDSDSDIEDIYHVINQSKSQLCFTEQVLNKHISKISSEIWLTDYEEIVATCKENKRCLKVILENVKEGEILSFKERKEVEELLNGWSSLQIHADELHSVSSLQQKLSSLRKMLVDTTARINSLVENLNDLTSLDSIIEILKEEMQSLLEFKDQLCHLNDAVHELVSEPVDHDQTISSVMPQLKEDVSELHQIWSKSFESVSTRLTQLQKAVETWHKFDREISDLQSTLQGDHSTLLSLGKSLDDGASPIEDVAVSIRDIARVLSEVPGNHCADNSSQVDARETCGGLREGSLSDSGISDAGSEHELYVRARRLASLRLLAQNLQNELGTSEGVVTQINERIDHLDHELHHLQEVCRKLIVRTRYWMETPRSDNAPVVESKSAQPEETFESVSCEAVTCETCEEGDSGSIKSFPWDQMAFVAESAHSLKSRSNKKSKQRTWVWRVLRTAVPLQLALLSLLCLACVFEPHCCESVNNLSFKLSPQLRYVYGPPPV